MNKKDTITEEQYWNNFYSKKDFELPSQFCVLLASENDKKNPIVEFGCGNGRDALFLARHGYIVTAVDLSREAIKNNNSKAEMIANITFLQGDVSIPTEVTMPIVKAREGNSEKNLTVYSRFFLHTLDDDQERIFLYSLSKCLQSNDLIYFEFRSKEDEKMDKIYGNHFRRYIDTNQLLTMLSNKYGFEIEYQITGQGMAKYNSEDPFVSRIIARKT